MKYIHQIVMLLLCPFMIWLSYRLGVRALRRMAKRYGKAWYDAQDTPSADEF